MTKRGDITGNIRDITENIREMKVKELLPEVFPCTEKNIAPMRTIMIDALKEGQKKRKAWGWFEIDVSRARKFFRELKQTTGETQSFTAFVLWCVGKAIDENKAVHSVLIKNKKLVTFDDVDVSTLIEREDENHQKIVATTVIRSVNKKTYAELNAEMHHAQTCDFTGVSLGSSKEAKRANFLARLPRFIRKMFWRKVRHDAHFRKKLLGTVNLSAVGMFLTRGGWAMTYTLWPCDVIVGGIVKKPAYVGDTVVPRYFLDLSIAIDHDAIDGAPAARFVSRLCELLETGEGVIPSDWTL